MNPITTFKPNPGLNPAALPEWRKLTKAVNDLERHRTIVTGKLAGQSRSTGAVLGRISTAVAEVTTGGGDTRAGNAPTSLGAVATGYFDGATGNPSTQVVLTWTAPATYTDGDPYTASGYEIWRQLTGGEWQFITEVSGASATLMRQPFAGSTYQYEVRAQSADNGLLSAFSAPVTVTPPTTLAALAAPGAPTLATSFGYVTATWDGLIAGATPPAGFRGVYAETATSSSGPWTAGGQNLLTAGATALGPFGAGTVIYVRLRAVDALGQAGTAGSSASITVVGLDSADSTAISAAQSTANTALTTANGKNQITRSTAAASGSGVTTGDMWWQVDGTGAVIASWSWQGGAWVSQTLSSTFIPNLDAGKITTGYLSAGRIATGTISASQLLVSDFTNLFENPLFDSDTPGAFGQPVRGMNAISTARVETVNSAPAYSVQAGTSNNDTFAQAFVPVKAGDQIYGQVDARFLNTAGTGGLRFQVRWFAADKVTVLSYSAFFADVTPTAGGTTFATYGGSITAPANAAYMNMMVTFANNGETTNRVYIKSLLLNRRANANLIVDGSITTAKIATGSITSSLITTTGLTGITITGSTIQTLATASRGIKISGTTLQAFDGSGNATLTVDGSTGAVTAVGLNATTATISGAITATSGAITGTMTVSGTLQTGSSGARVVLTSAGLTGYNSSGTATFQFLTSSGVVTATGGTFTGVTVTGAITATSGSITGALTMGASGSIFSGSVTSGQSSTTFSNTGILYEMHGTMRVSLGSIADADTTTYGLAFDYSGNPKYGVIGLGADTLLRMRGYGGVYLVAGDGLYSGPTNQFNLSPANAGSNGIAVETGPLTLTSSNVTYQSGGGILINARGDLTLGTDSASLDAGYVKSVAIMRRTFGGAAADTTAGGSTNAIVVVDNTGKMGTLRGYLQDPDGYGRVVSTRAVYFTNLGTFGTTSSSRRVKKNIKPLEWDNATVKRWLDIKPVEFEYKDGVHADGDVGVQHGFVAEDAHDAGFKRMVYYDDRPGTKTKGRVDGFAYERMGVYDHLVLGHLYDELMSLRKRVAVLEGA